MVVASIASCLLVFCSSVPATSADAPARLSRDRSRPDIDSEVGSGGFGRWTVDRFGLPAYRYTIDQTKDRRARNPEMADRIDAWHQLGNDHIVANAYNHGYVQLWSQDRLYQWVNFPAHSEQHHAGGYGYLKAGKRITSTLYVDRPNGANTEREFGIGYFRKRTKVRGADVDEFVYAPFGDDPVLLHEVTIRNTASRTLNGSWFEYWDVNPQIQANGQRRRGVLSPAYDKKSRTLTADQVPLPGDTEPLTIYASALNAPVSGFDTDVESFFGTGTRARPQAVSRDTTTDSIAPPSTGATPNRSMFSFRSPIRIAPDGSVTLRFAYGMARREQIPAIVGRYRGRGLRTTIRAWSDWLPKISFNAAGAWLSREMLWDAYMVRSGATYEESCGHHILSQGGYYQYDNGFQGAFRDPLQHMMPMIYAEPSLAREVLRYSAMEQPSGTGFVPYGMLPNCLRFDFGSSNDLDFWFIWAAAEYVLATRDFAFLDEVVPFADSGEASMWEHLKLAYFHQETLVGRGPHGGYITGLTGDWADFETQFMQMTESMLVTAQLAYAYPLLAQVADVRGDKAFAATLRRAGARNVETLKREWTGKGWFSRGYAGPNQIGYGAINSEPQPWALLAGAATPHQQRTLLRNIRRFLTGIGAPGGPSKIGSAQSPGRDDPDVTEHSIVPQDSAVYVGNVWYALNGALVWASAAVDPRFAWDEFLRNTLARHATAFPNHWDGIISVDDVCHAWYTLDPSRCGTGLSSAYYGQILHQPAWSLFDAIKLAGLIPTRDGYSVEPRARSSAFSLRFRVAGIERKARSLTGYVRPEGDGRIAMKVALPRSVRAATAWVDGKRVASTLSSGRIRFAMNGRRGTPSDWAVTW